MPVIQRQILTPSNQRVLNGSMGLGPARPLLRLLRALSQLSVSENMKFCRFETSERKTRIGVITGVITDERTLLDLTAGGLASFNSLFELSETELANLVKQHLPRYSLADVRLLPPVERQEVWAA